MKILLKLYLKLIRNWLSPLLYWLFRYTKFRGELQDKWTDIKDLNVNDFHKKICYYTNYKYLSDPLNGFIDYSPQEKNFFFLDKDTGRDCDDWARMWYWYHKHHNREVYEIAMYDLNNKTGHMVVVAKFNDGYKLFDYRPINNVEKTIEDALKNNIVNYNNFIWIINKA
jgi:hypothetical protein